MTIRLSEQHAGEIGVDQLWFSDLYLAAYSERLTGGILVNSPLGAMAAMFRGGSLIHLGGTGFGDDPLGNYLRTEGHLDAQTLKTVLKIQHELGEDHPPIGQLLVERGLDPADLESAVLAQMRHRLIQMLKLDEGSWQAAQGNHARTDAVAQETDSLSLFFALMEEGAGSTSELRVLADSLLGQAVSLNPKAKLPVLEPRSEKLEQLLHYLQKARKPDQLERALGRRSVRSLLRGLQLFQGILTCPVSQAVPIAKATLLKGTSLNTQIASSRPRSPSKTQSPPASSPDSVRQVHPLEAEVKAFVTEMRDKNHFEVLGATPKTPASDLRRLYTKLAKRFHPDAFPAHTPEDILEKARSVTARLNEAYQTLANAEQREQYLALLNDDRIRGDIRRAERIKEASIKAQMGLVMFKKREYASARNYYRFAVDNDASNAEYLTQYALCHLIDNKLARPLVLPKAQELLEKAIAAHPDHAPAFYHLGKIHLECEAPEKAKEAFQAALSADPNHKDAARELKRLKQSDEDEKKKSAGSAFSRLFKRS